MPKKEERIKFDDAIKKSIKTEYKGHFKENRSNYYENDYANNIKAFFKAMNINSLEVNYNKKYDCIPICSLSSSGRLCYLYFKNKKGVKFEKQLTNDIKSTTKMDAVIGNVFYECKCQEIIDRSHSYLSKSYLNSNLYKELVNDNRTYEEKTKVINYKDKNGSNKTKYVIDFMPSLLGIEDTSKKHIFDYKQLVCHLIAIAHNTDDKIAKVLNYVIFKPNNDVLNNNNYKIINDTYVDLNTAIDSILKAVNNPNTPIGNYCSKNHHNIKIGFDIIEIKDVDDFNYRDTKWN